MGVIYYKLKSEYEGDVTVERSLRCDEVDGNFYFLRGFDINEIGYDEDTKDLVLTRVNGEKLSINLEEAIDDIPMSFDPDAGILYIGNNEISGFTKDIHVTVNVAVNDTLRGNGDKSNPIRICETEKTGTFAAADEYRDLSEGDETLTDDVAIAERLAKGYRIVTKENFSKLGLLFSYGDTRDIQEALDAASSPWRVPSKADWDKMLSSIESDDECEKIDHESRQSNEWLGETAGKKLKTSDVWNNSVEEAAGTDNYGFSILPAGYIEDSGAVAEIRKYAAFWTTDEEDAREDMFIKRFDDESPKVYQSTWDPNKKLSLRLVKDYNGFNFYESEYIEGINITVPCVLMSDSETVWTQVNIAPKQFNGVTSEYWDNFTELEKNGFNSDVYVLNEWDGETWIKRQLSDGQSVVLRNYDDPEKGMLHYHEYIVIKTDGKYDLRDTVAVIEDEFEEELEAVRGDIAELNENLSGETEARISADDELGQRIQDETDRALSAETVLHQEIVDAEERLNSKIEAEETRATEAEDALSIKIDGEEARAISAETSLHSEIEAETTRATEAEEGLGSRIEAEETRATNSEAELHNEISSETARAMSAETELGAELITETERATSAESSLHEEIVAETSRATGAEAELDEKIESETGRATNAEAEIRSEIASAETGIRQELNNEIQRAENAEAELDAKIDTEALRAQSVETALSNNLNSEIERSTQKDNELNAAILDEQSRAEVAEESLHDEITTVKESAGLDSNGNYVPNGNANYISQATTLKDADNKLDEALKLEEVERKGIHIVKVDEQLPVNVKEAYDLVDKNGVRVENSERVLIYKDSSLVNVYLGTTGDELVDYDHPDIVHGSGDTAICFVYQMNNGQYRLIKVDVEKFLQETEFEDGLSVEHGVVKVKVDELSDEYLTVSANGVKLSGVKSALTSENQRAVTAENTLTTNLNAEITRAQNAETDLQNALNSEVAARTNADNAITANLVAERNRAYSAETEITHYIETEIANEKSAREIADQALTNSISAEEIARTNADTALAGDISYEATARENADSVLANSISSEATSRENADGVLTNAINVLNGAYNQTGSVKKTVIDSVIGTVVTSITPEQAKDQSLARIIDGTGRFYVSSNSLDIKYGNTNVSAALDSADMRITALETGTSTTDTRINALEASLATATTKIQELESALSAVSASLNGLINGLDERMKLFNLGFIQGYENQIAVVRCDSSGNPTQITDETKFVKIKFAPDAIFMSD